MKLRTFLAIVTLISLQPLIRAAKADDVSLYGIALGQPIGISPCHYDKIRNGKNIDYLFDEIKNLDNRGPCAMPRSVGIEAGGQWFEFHYPISQSPDLLARGNIEIWVKNGQVSDISFLTTRSALSQLEQKFGRNEKPGTSFSPFAVEAVQWQLSGGTVELRSERGGGTVVEAWNSDVAELQRDRQLKRAAKPHL